ncbi:YbgA family protein [Sedimenticola sp.]|uniref:YbgA family protein n=1 Tax=Sedimenticola sp. TaxID=1940285 RepID=UPI003D15114C
MQQNHDNPVTIGISSCLLGEPVRYDGGHKRDRFITDQLGEYLRFVPICPEMGSGMPAPRPPIRLVGDPHNPRAVGVDDPEWDVTRQLQAFSNKTVSTLDHISGYILKKDSPSCGMKRVKVYPEQGGCAERKGAGIFAATLMSRLPNLPVEEEGRLNDPVLRENFINRVFVYHHWQQLQAEGLTPAKLIDFHAQHKYLVMAHSQAAYKRMGRLLSNVQKPVIKRIGHDYFCELMNALQRPVNRKGHTNVLQHIMGYLKRRISAHDKQELGESIERYRLGEIPLVVPITLFRHYFRLHPDPYIANQVYLQPHPEKLGLRNQL